MPEITDEQLESFNNLQTTLEGLQTEFDAVKGKNEELLTETKTAKTKAREIEQAAELAKLEAAKKAGDFESLFKSSESEREKLATDLQGLQSTIATEKRDGAALKIATELADGSNAELLSQFIAQRLKFSDNELKVTDQSGELTVSSLDDLKKEFSNNAKFAALLKGNQSSGGGASGGTNGSGAAKTMTRSDFDGKSPAERQKFFADGGKLTD